MMMVMMMIIMVDNSETLLDGLMQKNHHYIKQTIT